MQRMHLEELEGPDEATSGLDSMSPLANKLSNVMGLSDHSSKSHSHGHQNSSIKITLSCYYDPISRRDNPPAPFDPIHLELRDGVFIKIGRPVRGSLDASSASSPTNPTLDSMTSPAQVSEMKTDLEESSNDPVLSRNETAVSRSSEIKNIWFKSKVVSRTHSELWMKNGLVYIRDAGSSSGSFLNGMRLSPPGKTSRPYPLKDGDVVQFGIDYQGRQEDIFKAIVAEVALKPSHPHLLASPSNNIKFKRALQSLLTASNPFATGDQNQNSGSVDCCICLSGIGPFQALFLGPCSHCFHYKCVRNILAENGFMFPCPVCRQVANLEASVSMESLCETFDDSLDSTDSKDETEFGTPTPFNITLRQRELKTSLGQDITADLKVEAKDEEMDQCQATLSRGTLPQTSRD